MIPHDTHLHIGSLLFEGVDQIDLTGPFEVLSRIPNSTYRIYGKTADPVRDLKGLRLTPDAALTEAPQLDVLHVPGGFGQEALMEDAEVLGWIARQASGARSIFSVCTGALLCGAAGLLRGRRATTHWASFHLLPFFGAIPVNRRVVVDGDWVFAAGVTAGIDGALRLAAELRGDEAAEAIQLYMAYAPEPPFNSGTPETAPAAILDRARQSVRGITAQREETARRAAARLGIAVATVPAKCPAVPRTVGGKRGEIGISAKAGCPTLSPVSGGRNRPHGTMSTSETSGKCYDRANLYENGTAAMAAGDVERN
jgi:cyclohexyl-isocyanide hydratase